MLRDYQNKAVTLLRKSIMSGRKRPLLVLPCGAGKSMIFGKMIKSIVDNSKSILWLVHRRNLVFQMKDILEKHYDIHPGILMAGIEYDANNPVQLSTIQTYSRRVKLDDILFNQFFVDADVVLHDESHRSISKTSMGILSLYPNKIIIGCTATPMRLDGRGLGEVYDDLIEPAIVQELTDEGYLSPARYYVPEDVDLSGVRVAMGDYIKSQLENKVNTPKLVGNIVSNWLENGENRKTIVFCVNVKHSLAVRDEFVRNGVSAVHLDARSPDDERRDALQAIERDEIKVVCNVGIFTEGLDVPGIQCVIMARPTKSMGLYRQCCGRGLRVLDGKNNCIIFDHANVIYEHGFLTDEIIWSLDGTKKAWSKKTRPKEKHPVKCRVCNLVFSGSKKCPDCGTECKTFSKEIDYIEAKLKEIDPKKKNKKYDKIFKRQVYAGLLFHAKKKKYAKGWAAHAYRGSFGVWPNAYKGTDPIEPMMPEIKNFIRHILIKKACAYRKKGERVCLKQ